MDILKVLISERRSKKITQNKIADFIGCSKSLISRLESGKSIPNINYIQQYADYLGFELKLMVK